MSIQSHVIVCEYVLVCTLYILVLVRINTRLYAVDVRYGNPTSPPARTSRIYCICIMCIEYTLYLVRIYPLSQPDP